MPAGTLEVFLIGAVGIKDTEIFGKGDPYANLLCGKQKLRSNTASNQGTKPIWNQKFSFYIDDKATELQIKIYNHNILKEDDEIGSTVIPLGKVFADGKLATTSYNVVRPSGRVQGEVKLSITFTPKQRAGLQTVQDTPGPYNATVHGSPYATEPGARHDPLTGPYGYFKTDASRRPSSHGSNNPHSLDVGSNKPYPPPEANAYPPTALPTTYPPVSSVSEPYQRTQSGASYQHTDSISSSSDDSSHGGRLYPVAPSTSTDYTGSIYVQSPYRRGFPRPAPPPHLTSLSHHGSASSSPPPAYPPPGPSPGRHNPSYPPPSTKPPPLFQVDNLAGNFGSMKISPWNDSSSRSHSSHGSYPGYHNTQNVSDHNTAAGYPRLDSTPGHSPYDYPSTGRPAGGYPQSAYPDSQSAYPTCGNPPQYDSSQGEYPQPGSYSLYGYQVPPPSFYPQQLGVPQQPYGKPDAGGPPPPTKNSYPPAPYYDAPPAHYVPAGYSK